MSRMWLPILTLLVALPAYPQDLCTGFVEKPSFDETSIGGCLNRPAGTICIRFTDGYLWLVSDQAILDWEIRGACPEGTVGVAVGVRAEYHHIYRTNLVKEVLLPPPPADPGAPPAVGSASLSFSLVQGGPPKTQGLLVSSPVEGRLSFDVQISAQGVAPESLLSVSPVNGQLVGPLAEGLGVTLAVTALTGSPPGTYSAEIDISNTDSGESVVVPVAVAISARQQLLRLSQTGVTFTGVQGGGVLPRQSFRILNDGLGALNWDTSISTLSGGGWLSATPMSGTSDAVLSPMVELTVDSAELEPASYYGLVEVAAPDAASSPQFVTVVLNLLPAESNPGPTVMPSGLVFSNRVNGLPQTSPHQVQILNLTSSPTSFTSSVSTTDGSDWLQGSPGEGTVVSSQPTTVEVAVDPESLEPGIYRGAITFSFDDASLRTVNVVLSVVPGDAVTLQAISRAKNGCTRSQVAPVFRVLGGTSPIPAAWPASIKVEVVDDCGLPMEQGSAVVDFTSISSPSLALTPSRDGVWTSTWNVPNITEQSMAGVTVTATDPTGISGGTTLEVAVAPNAAAGPKVFRGGVVHAGSFVRDPLGPGTLVSIFGESLSTERVTGGQAAISLPLATELAGTAITLGGRPLPLLFSREDQVNAVLPFEVEDRINESLPLLVRRTGEQSISVSRPVFVTTARPGIFTQDASGTGPGSIQDVNFQIINAANPARVGAAVIIYCTGLGGVTPEVATGEPAPNAPPAATVEEVTVTIDGKPAQVLFAGLTPGFTSLYQVNAVVPPGVAAGEIEVVVSVAGQVSSVVTLFVE